MKPPQSTPVPIPNYVTNTWGLRFLLFVSMLISSVPSFAQTAEQAPEFLWSAPKSGDMVGSVFSGYALGDGLNGPRLGASALFFFDHFVGGISGGMTFLDDGTSYSMILQTDGRYGPVYAGFLFGMKWLPGRGDVPAPFLGFQLALVVPLGIEGLWLDFAYRPGMILFKRSQMLQQSFCLGLVIEAGL